MGKEIPKVYDPKQVENKWYDYWLKKRYFHAEVNPNKKPFTIVIPPPNVTARLHMGHAFNNTIQDILVRYHRKLGYETLWLPGTDHAGIATQSVVERELLKTGKSRYDLGREAFVKKVWEWKEEHGSTIIHQLKMMGCSLDWDRERFTLDEGLSRAVKEVFIRLYEKGLIYKGLRIVNWDPASATALADDEVEHKEIQGHLYHIRYKFEDSDDYIVVATTRPETLLGDTAVAIAPDDEEKKHLLGKKVIIPFVNRPVKIIADEHVDKEFGTGFVKVTPAHDPNDFEIGQRHNLPMILVLDKDGKVLPVCKEFKDGEYVDELPVPDYLAGLDRFEAREAIIEVLEELGQLEKIEPHVHAVGHSYRSKVPIEPYLSVQWFVKMKPLAKEALRVVQDGKIKFHPEGRFEKTYEHWMTDIRDWCISRQLWWGHRIPVYYCQSCGHTVAAQEKPGKCPKCGGTHFEQDPDVLDTWFSSWLWPFSTLGWPDDTPELHYFYPTDVLVTGPDIIFFWVARMIMAGLEFMKDIPFRHVYFNGIVRDEQGRKMSKSLGNGIDPLEMIEQYSADAMRFTLIMLSSEGQDINLGKRSFEIGRNFSNKIWNAFRFLAMNAEGQWETDLTPYREHFTLEDRWILSRYQKAIQGTTAGIENFRVNDAINSIYHFFWDEYCDWYLEMIKRRLYQPQNEIERKTALAVAAHIMKGAMELLHPFIPFITEEIWQNLKSASDESIVISPWPQSDEALLDETAERQINFLKEAIGAIRNLRAEMNVAPAQKIKVHYKAEADMATLIADNFAHFAALAKIEELTPVPENFVREEAGIVVVQSVEFFIPLREALDLDKEKARLEKEIQRLEGLEKSALAKLNNQNFLNKAPEQVVQAERNKLANIRENLTKLRGNYEKLFGQN